MNRIKDALDDILTRQLPDGGVSNTVAGPFNPEASAWTVLALKASGSYPVAAASACQRLAASQQSDGRVNAFAACHGAYWPTSLCILALRCCKGYEKSIDAGVQFLLRSKGVHREKAADSPMGHDTTIVGWPWIEGTHSWIEPTCLAVLALKACGYRNHPRTTEAVRMILDRQLPAGGWNYGNTTVFGNELLPIPENTGQALCALEKFTGRSSISRSITYLDHCLQDIRTPMTLAWALFGLASWSRLPANWEHMIAECLDLQKRYGAYDTALLAQIVTVYYSKGRILEIMV